MHNTLGFVQEESEGTEAVEGHRVGHNVGLTVWMSILLKCFGIILYRKSQIGQVLRSQGKMYISSEIDV